ncbi:Siderophore biosynthesis non-ribosomal peptide synthetase modules Bacillibactin synthetase component F [Rhodococcus wratislaviensis]|uniref:Siderophore biosynthesis non-ribosomal peptide synthetase modules Bacillibactin synthetase component F n=1 Tax=Rhodococcus wratislaviensis TaxID=44752 RepID=A0A402C7G8_RHOWR|nr:non-ribosomal peptide synthetase [Rhodococcus wratislaviensis]GCE39566.1 Siderophore biosynthesis non-ribosomal peptide synthetase modules Bacillibactin synthetase component F [Rhodococcus wratislaviensis]
MGTGGRRESSGEVDPRAFPLSHAQKGLWFAQQLHPDVPFLVAQYVELRGHVDVGALRWASEQGSFDLESPGIRLIEFDGEPYQLADETIEDELGYVDLREYEDPVNEAHLWIDERRRRPMHVFSDRLINATLLHIGEDHYFLTTFAHHLTLDGYGAMVLMNRVAELYTHAVARTEAPPSKALRVRELYEAEDAYPGTRRFEIDREYWAERTPGLPEPSRLTERRAYPSAVSELASEVMDPEVAERIGGLAREWNSTAVPVVVAAFAAFLARMTGNADIVLSLPVSARTTAAARRSGGSVANVVPLRVQVDPWGSVADLVRRVQLELTGALRHQRYRYEDILHDARSSSRESNSFGPMINIMMFHQETWWGDVLGELNVLATGPVDDLSINLYPGVAGRSIRVDFEGNPAVYDRDELGSHHARFMRYLDGFTAGATNTSVGSLPILTGDERDVLVPAGGPAARTPLTLPEILDETAGSDAVALRDSAGEMTYRELHDRSNRLARKLIRLGVGAGDRVALMLPRSVEHVVAVWAVARTGGAFVPVDPSYPDDRIAHMIAESDATMAIALGPEVVPAGVDWIDVADEPGDSRPVTDDDRIHPLRVDNAAYVIYTSGSVGAPRGTTMTHRGLANHAAAVRRLYAADARSRVLACASPSYDASIHDMLVAATAGATLVTAPPTLHGGTDLLELLRRERITHWTTTPAVPAALDPAGLDALQVLAVAGDVCAPELVSRWGVGRRMLNLYGPTEVTIWSTATEVLAPGSPVTIGRPIEGVSAVVLDRSMQPIPVGVVGELYLSGPGVGRGYLERPGATAARFVANPYSSESERMYRTGDLVRWTKEHLLEFVDRVDDQVKIRGFRVELGEVTAVLGEHPGVDSAIAVAHSRDDELIIDGYVSGAAVDSEKVLSYAAQRLPEYMVPATVTVLDTMPLTPSGKVDRSALPVPAPHERELRYWREQLRGMPHTVPLPTDHEPGRSRTSKSAVVSFAVNSHLRWKLEKLAHEHECTLFTVVHAALAVVLSTVSGADDFAIGALFDDSTFPLGRRGGPLVLRNRIDPRATFADLVAESKRTECAAVSHADIPFDLIASTVGGDRNTVRHPLFQVSLAVADAAPELGSLDLAVSIRPRSDAGKDRLEGQFSYAAEFFDEATAQRWADRLQRLFVVITDDPRTAVGSIDLLTEDERATAVGGTPEPMPPRTSLPELFLRRVAERPDSIAVSDASGDVTYAELARRSEQVSHQLLAAGVSAESVVGVAISESVELVVAHVAVLRVGAACLPMPPEYPTERLRYILADARPTVVLSRRTDVDRIPAAGSSTLLMETLAVPDGDEPAERVRPIHPDSAAYMLCHAGMKPILLTHANLLARIRSGKAQDVVFTDIWGALVAGDRAVIGGQGSRRARTLELTSGMRAYVLDRSLRPVPPGTAGELYVAGYQIGRGFARRSGATADRFVADPFINEVTGCSGRRMYRTGEMVRYVDGELRPALDARFGTDLERWRHALRGVGTPAPLPTDRSDVDDVVVADSTHRFSVSAASHEAGVRLARRESATLFTVLRAALAVLLSRLGVHRDLVIGGEAGHAREGTNTLALRARLTPEMTFREVLGQVRDFDVAAFEHADVPFEELADLLGGRRPQVALALSPAPSETSTTAPFDLSFTYSERWSNHDPAGLDASVRYSPDLFDEATIHSLAELFSAILDAVAASPDTEVSDIPLNPGAALDGGTGSDAKTFADILTATAVAYPTSPALTDGEVTLTYRELDRQSDELAGALTVRGAAPGGVVALGLPRSVDFMIALWAITKTGAAFLPVDPTHPAERLDRVLTEAGVRLGVGQMSSRVGDIEWVPVQTGADTDITGPARVPVRPDEVAYIIYTSGSTGTPKGVMVTHRGLASLTDEAVRRYRVTSNSRVLQGYNPTFDAALLETLLAFGSGGCLVVAPADVYAGPDLHRVLVQNRVTHYLSTPAVLSSLDVEGLDHVEVVAVGGEALPADLAAVWSDGRLMLNAYGPTESTVVATLTEVEGQVTIGGPIAGTTAVVLDDRLRRVPVGGIGELYLSGPALARGYVGSPARSAGRFVAGPHGARMYRTGDLVHRRADGNLHFISRVDRQVKIRGVRIEPGEVDAAIKRESDVDGAITVARPNTAGTDMLVSYVVRRESLDVQLLRKRLEDALPSYLVPTAIVVLDSFPLNASGKIDVKALPEPVFETRAFRAPGTAVERTVAGVFADVLAVDHVGLDDDFFAMGGNSLIATQLAARLGAALDAHIPVRLLFEASTVEALAQRVASEVGGGIRVPLSPRPRPGRIPLSLAQQRMWFLSRFDPHSPAYNLPLVVRLTGDLDVAALQGAVNALLDRHESLRTVFPEHDGEPVQVVLPASQVQLDLTPIAVDAGAVERHVLPVVTRGFDVTTSVPIRGKLFQVSKNEFVLAMAVHHISGDGFSMAPLARDVMTAYVALSSGEEPAWTPLPVQYADFALWQREVLGSEDDPGSLISQQLDYWKSALSGLPDQLELPTDRPRPPVQSYAGGRVPVAVDAEIHRALVELARTTNSTLFMVMHTALAVFLARMSGTGDIAIGTPIAGRGEAALDDLVGMFVNTMVFRTSVDSADSFGELLAQTRERDIAGFGHADVPFERLVEVLNPVRSTARHPLFQVGFSFQNLAPLSVELPGLTVTGVEYEGQVSQFDLHLIVTDHYDGDGEPAGVSGYLTYAKDLFEASTVERFVERFRRTLQAVSQDQSSPVGDLDLLAAPERQLMLEGWNATAHPVDADGTLVSLFDSQVATTPNSVALVHEGRTLTYSEFDARVNRLARKLIALGVGPESLVGLAIRRSVDLIVGMYAVVKAGGAYVPLDPDQPAERISYIVDTASPVCVLTTSDSGFSARGNRAVLCVDTVDLSMFSDDPVRDAERTSPLRAKNAAYVIFTSGSTGKPKGVAVPHGAIVNQLLWMRAEFGLDGDDVVLLKTAATFDLSVWEFWSALVAGGQVVIANTEGSQDPSYLIELMRTSAVTTLHVVPSMLEALSVATDHALPSSLRRVLAIGEELPPATVQNFRDISDVQLFNLYGPTETAVSVTVHEVTHQDTSSVPIGRPEWNTHAYVLDDRLHPVPPGVPGELYLAGAQLARGYVARPELTAERFVANPYGTPGERLYRTGDRVAWGDDGELDFLGRTDFQVKLRGFRIELSEVEAALRSHAGVTQAIAVVRSDVTGGDRLVAYVVPAARGKIDVNSLKTTVAKRLPSYMMPGAFVELASLPLNVNGKVDRRALPVPEYEQRAFRPPTTKSELAVAAAFRELLGVDQIGADDNFFELGGNSLMAVRVLSRIEAATGSKVPLQSLMTDPTPASIAARMDVPQTDVDPALQVVFPIRSAGTGRPLFCIHPIVGLAWCYSGLASHVDPDRPIYGIQSPAIAGDSPLPVSIDELAVWYLSEIRRIQPSGPYDLLGWSLGGVLAHSMAVQLQTAGEDVATLAMLDSYARPPETGEGELPVSVEDLLAGMGYEGELPPAVAHMSPESAAGLLGDLGGPLSVLTPAHLERMIAGGAHNNQLLESHRPGQFHGSVLLFTAAHDDPTGECAKVSWEPYVDGVIRNRTLDSTHWHMTSPRALEAVGDALRRAGAGRSRSGV